MYITDRDSIDYVHNGQRQREISKLVTESLRRVSRVRHVTCKRQRELSYLVLNWWWWGGGGGGQSSNLGGPTVFGMTRGLTVFFPSVTSDTHL